MGGPPPKLYAHGVRRNTRRRRGLPPFRPGSYDPHTMPLNMRPTSTARPRDRRA